ncbi:MAG: hypothetical protein BZY88_05525 [SAR202 cluster bacterium Io17-Chloro-G9]|nr:MAG: hypothetical protein BZY88_05525 [SAR202 cluster bacterium Io17-Chloro-G9]
MPVLPEFSLAGRVAILSTAGSDEAPFLAQALAEAGASVFTIARRQESLDLVLQALERNHDRAPGGVVHGGIAASLATKDGVDQAMAAFDVNYPTNYGQADILVNDGRSMLARPFDEITPDEWDEVHSRNAKSAFLLCQAVGSRMVERGYGRVVNVISELAERGMINGSAFAASQAVLLSLTRSMAVEWGKHNIRVNALGTGWFSSEDLPLEEQQEELLVRYTPLRRRGHPRDIGPLLVYLCSESCDYSTGQPVYVDGGLNAHP